MGSLRRPLSGILGRTSGGDDHPRKAINPGHGRTAQGRITPKRQCPPGRKEPGGHGSGRQIQPTKRRKKMTDLFYTKTAASRILNAEVTELDQYGTVWVARTKRGPDRLIERHQFLKDFAESRKARGRELPAPTKTEDGWEIKGSKGRAYQMQDQGDRLHCSCPDFRTQEEAGIKRPCCKHIYATLFAEGYKDYQQWQDQREMDIEYEHYQDRKFYEQLGV